MNVPSLNKKTAFVIGNGKSRENVQLENLRNYGTVFGCNALYRDWYPDYLVAIDPGMIGEIENSDFPKERFIVPPLDEQYEPPEIYNLPTNASTPRSNAGMNAMLEAIRREHNILYCLGFDFILEGEKSIENIYKGSKNYEPHTQSNTSDNYFRVRYCDWFVNQHDDVKFVFVVPDNIATKKLESKNIIGMKVSTFNNKIKGTS